MNNAELIARLRETASEAYAAAMDRMKSALEAAQPAGEPVAWGYKGADGMIRDCIADDTHCVVEGGYKTPLYTHPAPQAPMTGDEIDEAYLPHRNGPYERAFTAGIKAAEAHHGVKP